MTEEEKAGCDAVSLGAGNSYLDECTYMLENTKFQSDLFIDGYWLETPSQYHNTAIWWNNGVRRLTDYVNYYDEHHAGTRPVIEVLKTDIEY